MRVRQRDQPTCISFRYVGVASCSQTSARNAYVVLRAVSVPIDALGQVAGVMKR